MTQTLWILTTYRRPFRPALPFSGRGSNTSQSHQNAKPAVSGRGHGTTTDRNAHPLRHVLSICSVEMREGPDLTYMKYP